MDLGVYDVLFETETGLESVRVYAEDEYHAEDKVRAMYPMPKGIHEVVYRGEA
jgi:hypothetical protein